MDTLGAMRRTHSCNDLRLEHLDREVTLTGWVLRRRDHGGVIFIDLRDRWGLTQVVFNPEVQAETHAKAHALRPEWVIGVRGRVAPRPEGMENPKLATGAIEIMVDELRILNTSVTPPFPLDEEIEVSDALRLQYRYLDLRRPEMAANLVLRHRLSQTVRCYLSDNGFLEIETPMLTRSTPEGARDYLVPSRVNPGRFYALPQSPQLFKQLLMVAGMDRYFQIVKCFRDEDLRADRQPEFTQIDMELSFVGEDDIQRLMEGMMTTIFRQVLGRELVTPFPRMTYDEAMRRYGCDRPDTRFGLELVDLSDLLDGCGFKVFQEAIAGGGRVQAINAKGCAGFSRKELDDLTEYAGRFGARGMAWIKVKADQWQSPITKFFSEAEIEAMRRRLGAEEDDLILFAADRTAVTRQVLSELRLELARRLGLITPGSFNFLWVTDFPLLEFDAEAKRHVAVHHPFTAPLEEQLDMLESTPGELKSRAYDLVLNGSEIGGGSIRIHRRDVQDRVFRLLGIDDAEAQDKFGFLLRALELGAPPHGGIAFGLDRLTMILAGRDTIRDVIAFPKTQKATCPLTEAPAPVERKQLTELALRPDIREQVTGDRGQGTGDGEHGPGNMKTPYR